MKKTIVIVSSIMVAIAAVAATLVTIDYKMSHKRYVKATVKKA